MSSCKNNGPVPPPDGGDEPLSLVMEQPIAGKVTYDKGNANTAANYYFGLSIGEIEIYTNDAGESAWIPSNKDGAIIYFDLYATAQTHEGTVIMIPEGEYVVDKSVLAGKANSEYTYGLWYMSDGKLSYASCVGGKVTVTHTGSDSYLIVAQLDMTNDLANTSLGIVTIKYEGTLPFGKPAPGEEVYPRITESINTTFKGVDAHYLGVAAYTSPVDTYFFDFFDDPTPAEDGSLDEGNVFRLEIYTPHQGYLIAQFDPVVEIPDGTYNMVDGYVPVETGVGMGDLWDSGYGLFAYGSYVRHLKVEDETVLYGFLNTGGSVKVAKTNPNDKKDKKYTFTVDCVTREGVSVKGTYSGEVNIVNESAEMDPPVQSKLEENKVLNLNNVAVANVDFYGTSRNQQTHFYTVAVEDPVSRQSFQLWILGPPNGLIAGTYKVSDQTSDLKRVPFTYILGDIQLVAGGADMVGTWGYHESNEAGKSIMFAPASKGDIVISVVSGSGADTQYKIKYVLTDDNPTSPHTMTAEFNGKFTITDKTAASVATSSYKSYAKPTFKQPMLFDVAPKATPYTSKGAQVDKQRVAL